MTQTKAKSEETKCRVRPHSATQIEVVIDLPRPTTREWECRLLFLSPRQFHLAHATYPKDLIFHDFDSLIRFREPRYKGKELLNDGGFGIRRVAEELLLFDPIDVESITKKRRIQTLCRSFASGYFDYVSRRLHKFEVLQTRKHSSPEKLASHVGKTIERALSSLNEWMKLCDDFATTELAKGIKNELAAVREFCSYAFADALARLIGLLQRDPGSLRAVSQHCDLYRVQEEIRAVFLRFGYCWVDESTTIEAREDHLNRKRKLKLRVMSDLFLKVEDRHRFWLEEHFGAMVAAALAAVWATSINLAVIHLANAPTRLAEIGISSATIFAVFVTAYVLKDRIKEVGKQQFRNTLARFLADRLRLVSTITDARAPSQKIVSIREKIDYASVGEVLDRYKLGKRFAFLDKQAATVVVSQTFRFPRNIKGAMSLELRQLTRINVGRFLDRLDEPFVKSYAMTATGEVKVFDIPKNYYAGIVFLTRKAKSEPWRTDAFKVILSKRGIIEAYEAKAVNKTQDGTLSASPARSIEPLALNPASSDS